MATRLSWSLVPWSFFFSNVNICIMLLTMLEQNSLSSAQSTIHQKLSSPPQSHTHSAPSGQREEKDIHSLPKGNSWYALRAQPEGDALSLCASSPGINSGDPFSFSSPSLACLLLRTLGQSLLLRPLAFHPAFPGSSRKWCLGPARVKPPKANKPLSY